MKSTSRAAAALAVWLAACGGSTGPVVGTVASVTGSEDATQSAALIELDSGAINGSSVVSIIFDTDLPRCRGGGAADRPGTQVRAEPADFVDFDALDAAYPPGFQVKEVAVDCD